MDVEEDAVSMSQSAGKLAERLAELATEYEVPEDSLRTFEQNKGTVIAYDNGIDKVTGLEFYPEGNVTPENRMTNPKAEGEVHFAENARKIRETNGIRGEQDPEIGESQKEMVMQSFYDANINKGSLSSKEMQSLAKDLGISQGRANRRIQKDLVKAMKAEEKREANREGIEAKNEYNISKEEVQRLKNRLEDLHKKTVEKAIKAKALGMDPKDSDLVIKTSDEIKMTTEELADAQKDMHKKFFEAQVKNSPIAKAAQKAAAKLKEGFTSIGENAAQSIAKLGDMVQDAGTKAITQGKTAFSAMPERADKVLQNYHAANFGIIQLQAKVVDRYKYHLQKHYEKSSVRKAARKNLRQALKSMFTGKEAAPVQTDKQLTEEQQDKLTALTQTANAYRELSENSRNRYQEIAQRRQDRAVNIQNERGDAGLRSSDRLADRIRSANADVQKGAQAKAKTMPVKEKADSGERVR